MKTRLGYVTHPGQVRTVNEDAFAHDLDLGLFLVADGLGGSVGGRRASSMAVELVHRFYREGLESGAREPEALLCAAIQQANREIRADSFAHPEYSGMGTTVVGLVVRENTAVVAHVGDSRLYRFRADVLEQVTEDHSWVQELLMAGTIDAEEAEAHPMRHLVTRCLGLDKSVIVDSGEFDILPGDRLMLCTDGLLEHMTDEEIREQLCDCPEDPSAVCNSLLKIALEDGGLDNITIMTVDCLGETEDSDDD